MLDKDHDMNLKQTVSQILLVDFRLLTTSVEGFYYYRNIDLGILIGKLINYFNRF